jgi:thiol:disulfide interchange protein
MEPTMPTSTLINKKIFPIIAVIILATLYAAAFGGSQNDDITLELTPSRYPPYSDGDTIIIGVKTIIPQGYHLYSNPLGPGIGKPLNLFVNRRYMGADDDRRVPWRVSWVEARKSFPRRYNPPIGSWVWAYESVAYFFVKGVLERDSAAAAVDTAVNTGDNTAKTKSAAVKDKEPAKSKFFGGLKGKKDAAEPAKPETPPARALIYEIAVEALMCKSACIPVLQSVSFELPVPADTGVNANNGSAIAFPSAPAFQSHYSKSESVAFSVDVSAPTASAQSGIGGINTDLSGLSSLSDSAASQTDQKIDSASGAAVTGVVGTYDYSPLEERREYSLLTAILFALLAGLALNLTPCIFPMLSVRVLSFAESALESRRSAVVRSAVFSLGIVAVFLLLAGLAAFAGFSWGQQFQNPGTMVGIIAIVFLFALGMFNFYTLSVPAIGSGGGDKGGGPTFAGDFLKGAAATVMATPCGGPFLGALLAWALLQKPLTIFILFATMGVGMALPYVLLASSKRLMSLLPKPGRWIEDLKHFMGFLLLAFAVNMMRSLDPRLTTTAVGICLSILIAASVNKRFAQFGMPAARRVVTALVSLALLATGIAVSVAYLRIDVQIFNDDQIGVGGPYWSSFSQRALEAAHEEKRNVIVNFTASWCTNCKLNKAAALNTAAARQLYGEKNILLLTADITNGNPEAQELMRHLGSRSVPFLAIFPGDAPKTPVIMRDILSKEKFLGELRNLP